MTRRNSNEFDCPCCGNPLFKNRKKDYVRCIWCNSLVDYDGNILPQKKFAHREDSIPVASES